MEHDDEERMILCALYSVPQHLGRCPRKPRSKAPLRLLAPKILRSEKNGEETLSTEQAWTISLKKYISIARKRKRKIMVVNANKSINEVGLGLQTTLSPSKWKSEEENVLNLQHFETKVKSASSCNNTPTSRNNLQLDVGASLSCKRRRLLMFNQTDILAPNVMEFKNTLNDCRPRENKFMILGLEKSGKQYDQPKVSEKHRDEHANNKMVHEIKQVNKSDEVVGPRTPSPSKRKRGKATLTVGNNNNNGINHVISVSDAITKEEPDGENTLTELSNKIENAYYYTRSLNNLVVNVLMREQGQGVGHSLLDDKQRGVSSKKKSRIQKLVERQAMRAWSVLLRKGTDIPRDDTCWEDQFILKVGDVQGPRAYLPWKGSVLDSLIGALLTQRVRDDTSSSAFMSLSMIFPQDPACDLYSMDHISGACSNVPEFGKNSSRMPSEEMNERKSKKRKIPKEKAKPDWKKLREDCIGDGESTVNSVDWHAVMRSNVDDVADAILLRGMNQKLATRIKALLNRLVLDYGNLDLEWLRNAHPQDAKEFLLSIYGIGLKSTECVRLLTLRQPAFPVDVNVARVAVRLGWVPVPSISDDIQMSLLTQNSKLHDLIHGYLWPRLSKLDKDTLYQLHYQMITFGKVFCTKQKPNCAECPLKSECRYYSNQADSPSPCLQEKDIEDMGNSRITTVAKAKRGMSILKSKNKKCMLKETATYTLPDDDSIEDPMTLVKVALPRYQSIKNKKNTSAKQLDASKTRTEYCIYELPDRHPLLKTFADRDMDDPSPYLLVTWEKDAVKPEQTSGNEESCTNCVGGPRAVSGTIMIPYRTALKGNFPLNATHFQPNEVFADWQTSQMPLDIPLGTLEGLPRKKLYFGSNLTGIAKGRSRDDIRKLFHEDYICTRYFDRERCATRSLDDPYQYAMRKRKVQGDKGDSYFGL